MKIAFATDDGKTISPHFGRAHFFQVLTMENDRIVYRDLREKFNHTHAGEPHQGNGPVYGHSPIEQDRHTHMINAIPDCQIVIAGGMGRGAYDSLASAGLQPFLTDEIEIEEAAKKYLQGRLVDKPERLH
jgi:predicted Fe-Mo cluster-binding NifX family protein